MDKILIPWARPDFWGNEKEYVLDALNSSWISGGEYIDRLERDISLWSEAPYSLAVSNGTTALHLAYLAIDLSPGDEVIVPGFSFLAAANVALQMGAKPIFADVDLNTWCVTPESIADVITSRTKAVVPVHTYGNACRMDEIVDLCAKRGIFVIEDVAESLGTTYRGKLTGTFGDLGCFSFQATKTITTGEGGMVLTADDVLAEKMRLYRSHGMGKKRYWHDVPGLNFRLTNLQAAIGCAQFEKFDEICAARNSMNLIYRRELIDVDGIALQFYAPEVNPVVWAIAIHLSPEVYPQGRDQVMIQMLEDGIETRPGFYSASLMDHIYNVPKGSLPISLELGKQVISLPSSPTLSENEIYHICSKIKGLRR